MGKNILVAHGGGPTAVINTSLQGVIETARINGGFNKIYGAKFGAEGILKNDLLDLTNIPSSTVGKLSHTPATAIGSCRRKLSDKDYPAVIECMKKNDIGVFFYNGGNDSMDTCNKISILAEKEGLDLQVIGIPKTMDNDLAFTDNCPGFGSAARYAAVNASELALDANGLPIHVVVLELMGRNAGWVTAASALAARVTNCEVLTYLPEKLVDVSVMLSDIEKAYAKGRGCLVTVSEGLCGLDGNPLADTGIVDGFGHKVAGGVESLSHARLWTRLVSSPEVRSQVWLVELPLPISQRWTEKKHMQLERKLLKLLLQVRQEAWYLLLLIELMASSSLLISFHYVMWQTLRRSSHLNGLKVQIRFLMSSLNTAIRLWAVIQTLQSLDKESL